MFEDTVIKKSQIDLLLDKEPFMLDASEKEKLFNEAIFESFSHHIENNELFRNYCNNQGFSLESNQMQLIDYPYLPVNIFKKKKLYSVSNEKINATLSSSATSGKPSMIGIDSVTSKRQTVASIFSFSKRMEKMQNIYRTSVKLYKNSRSYLKMNFKKN